MSKRVEPIQICLADANSLMLGALSGILDRDPRFSLVATSKSTEGFLELVVRARFEVGIIDWSLPSLGAEQVLEILRLRPEAPRIVIYSDDATGDGARRAMAAGAAGYCARSEPPERLLDVAVEVFAGRMSFPFLDVRALGRDPMDTLTPREGVLLSLLAQGHSNATLARQLAISVNTVKYHLRGVFDKLAVNSRAQAIVLYYATPAGKRPAPPPPESRADRAV